MKIQLNGRETTVKDGLLLADLLAAHALQPERVAVERNGEVIPRDRFRQTPLAEGDRLEIVHFVGGG